jgi:NAD(P)H dehydrogenase (quinone)
MIVVTGAGGHLGRLVIEELLGSVPAAEIVATTRRPETVADLAARGVQVRHADFDAPETLTSAFTGADRLLLISTDTVGSRVAQHRIAIGAAVFARVDFIAYTSALHADISPLIVAPDHKATEDAIAASGLPHAFLRNGWYTENYAQTARGAAESGVIIGSAGDGRVASAARADYAAAAAAVLTTDGHENKVYELSGDTAWSYPELAAEVARISGREVVYRNLTTEAHRAALIDAGLPEAAADVYTSFDRDTERGALADTPGDLRALIGRPTTTLADSLTAILRT